MFTRAVFLSLLRAAYSYFGGGGSAAVRFLQRLINAVAITGQQFLVSAITNATGGGAGSGATADILNFGGSQGFSGDGYFFAAGTLNIRDPGEYFSQYVLLVTEDGVGGQSVQYYINGAADGSTGAVARSRQFTNQATGDACEIVGLVRFQVTQAMINTGTPILGVPHAQLTIRNMSGSDIVFPVVAAAANAVAGNNASWTVRRVAAL